MNNLSIIIPSKTSWNVKHCVRAIRAAKETCRIIVVNDGLDCFCDDCQCIEGIKPFIFSRNVNLGIQAAGPDDVLILNDDALLQSDRGFSLLQLEAEQHPEFGIIAATTNNVGNRNQLPAGIGLRAEPRMVCFVCVLIPRRTIDVVGLLDERFINYGLDDDDYSLRVRNEGLKIGIHDGCFVDHLHLKSTFRGSSDNGGNYFPNLEIFKHKWGVDNYGRPV